MIRAEKVNNKMRVCLEGVTYELIAEFFSIAHHVVEMSAETCFPEYREEFMNEFRKDIDNILKEAMMKTTKGDEKND